MITIDTRGLQRKLNKLEDLLKASVKRDIFAELGKFAADIIYKRTKSGFGVSSDSTTSPSNKRLHVLSPGYVDFRAGRSAWFTNKQTGNVFKTTNKGYVKKPRLGSFGTPRKSNLTLSGQMLDSISSRSGRRGFEIYLKGQRNVDLAQIHSDGVQSGSGLIKRKFLALTRKEQRIIVKEYESVLRVLARRIK